MDSAVTSLVAPLELSSPTPGRTVYIGSAPEGLCGSPTRFPDGVLGKKRLDVAIRHFLGIYVRLWVMGGTGG